MHLIVPLALLATLPAIVVWPHVGVLAWYWIGLMNPHRLVWGFASNFQFALIVGAITLARWLLSGERKRLPLGAVTVLLGILALWITWTTVMAVVPDAAFEDWDRSIKILAMTFVTIAVMATRERIHALVWLMVVSLGFFAVKGGIFTILGGGEYRVWGPPGSFIADNNQLAMALLMVLPFMRYLQLQSGSMWARLAMLGTMVVTVFSVLGSQSRGAFVALVIVGVALVLKSPRRMQIGALALGLALVGAWFVPQHWIERMETIETYEEDASAMARLRTWGFAYDVAVMRPLTGGGFNVYQDRTLYFSLVPEESTVHSFHSVYFEMLGEHGFIGLAIFLMLGYATWRTFSDVRKKAAGREDLRWATDLASMGQTSLLAYFSAGAFLNLAFFDLYYLTVAYAVLAQTVVREQLQVPAAAPAKARAAAARAPSPS